MNITSLPLPLGGYEYYSWMVPCAYKYVSSGFGYRTHPITGEWSMHKGVDLPCAKGTPVYATRDGIIRARTFEDNSGNFIRLEHEPIDGKPNIVYHSVYLHLDSFAPNQKIGSFVKQGTLIGYVGSTGRSTAPHLHFGILKSGGYVDPQSYIFGKQLVEPEGIPQPWESQEKEEPKNDDWVPLYGVSHDEQFEGTSEGLYKRRQHVLNDYAATLFDGKKVNEIVGGGYSSNGLTVNAFNPVTTYNLRYSVTPLPDISKPQVIAQYYDNTSGYRKGELPNNIKTNNSGPWLVMGAYIANYLMRNKGWTSPKAICALLGNMGAECGMNPARFECNKLPNDVENYKGGFGLIQWTPAAGYFSAEQLRKVNKFYEGGPYDVDTQIERLVNEFTNGGVYFVKKGKGLNSYLNSIRNIPDSSWQEWNCTITTKNSLISYIESNQSQGINVRGGDFGTTDDLPVELLTIAYAVNRERPSAKYWAPQKRVGYAQTFLRLLFNGEGLIESSYVPYVDPTNPPCSDPTKCSELWKSSQANKSNVNPYPIVSATECVLPSNNAYCWGLAHGNRYGDEVINLATSYDEDWFDYNRDNNIYDYGTTPRVGSIACWTYKDYDTTAPNIEKSCVAYVTEVLGSDVMKISWLKHKPEGYSNKDNINESHEGSLILTNYKNNWDMDRDKYTFRGFIYLKELSDVCSNITTEDEALCITANSSSLPYSSLTFSINNSKHYNKVRLIYDVEILAPGKDPAKLDFNLYTFCNRHIFFTQQILNTDSISALFSWNTQLPRLDDDYLLLSKPFPTGHILLSNSLPTNLTPLLECIEEKDIYCIRDIDETFKLYEYTDADDTYPVFDGDDNNVRYFNRTLPGYITIIPHAFQRDSMGEKYQSSIKIRVKKIILYR